MTTLKQIADNAKQREQDKQDNKWRITTDKGESINSRRRKEQHERKQRVTN